MWFSTAAASIATVASSPAWPRDEATRGKCEYRQDEAWRAHYSLLVNAVRFLPGRW